MTAISLVPGRPGEGNRFRRNLPLAVKARLEMPMPRYEPEVEAAMKRHALRSPDLDWKRISAQDVRDFLLAYCACFLALQTFLA
ncbi:hypothetical protein [Novosphingobium nitrogenifigens]|jgi:hypothetical protein|uniref:hypothetical protein n=1 Tax=Novosphingobium nitrogenifigens TaxID=378548 RepID=UPI00036CE2BF|nr:hypothetical protein [Novosphingobium nitrogenifigens]